MRGHHAFEACVEQLATAIRLGVYPLGTTLPPERELAERLQVSRATLREAMAALRQAGLVETTRGPRRRHGRHAEAAHAVGPGRRPDVAGRSAQDWLDALDFRRIVEPGRRRSWPPAATLDDERPRPSSSRRTRTSPRARKPAEHRQADSRFHLTIAALTGSPRVVEAVTVGAGHPARDAAARSRCSRPTSPTPTASTRALVRAILAGEPDRARRVMEEHCDDTAALLRGLVG